MSDVVVAAPGIARTVDRHQYRLEIEGLRAVAVLAVILFHAGFPVSGGYVGVDVFFVISGFLITRNILKDRESGIFTFRRFYIRRIRRLFPALAATLLLTLAGGFLFLAPDDMARLGRTAVFSVASLSNVLFWRESGYFDAAATLKPLLHTWSLSVEEQFYLVWPAAIVMASRLGRSRAVAAMVIIVGTLSFASAELFRTNHPGAVFYLVPFRMFELCTGAVLAFIPRGWRLRPTWAQLAMIGGLLAILYSAVSFDASTALRHFWSLLPCIGAALVILAGNTPWSGLLLSNRLTTAVGTISYSLYLVHWPIIVFYKYIRTAAIPLRDQLLLVLLCFGAATVMYRTVELPFRSGRTNRAPAGTRTAAFAGAAVALFVIAIGGHAYSSNGWAFRVPAELRSIPTETAMWNERNPVARVGSCFVYEQTRTDLDEDRCLRLDPAKPNYLIIGDSFAADAYVYLSLAYPGVNFLQATAGNCHPLIDPPSGDPICAALLRLVFSQFIPATRLDGIVLSASWYGQDLDPLERTIDVLNNQTPRVVLIGPGIRFPASPSALIFQSKRLTRDAIERDVDSHITPGEFTLNDMAAQRFRPKVAAFVDVQSIMCEGHCRLFTQEGQMIYIDFGHLTLAGSRYLAPRIAARYGNIFPPTARDDGRPASLQ